MGQQPTYVQSLHARLYDLEKLLDDINSDISKERKENPESFEKFKVFADGKKKHIRNEIKTIKDELSSLTNEAKGSDAL